MSEPAGPVVRGPYGTNVGDTWLAEGSPIQDKFDADGEGHKLVHYVRANAETGEPEDTVYVTANEELIEEARQGTERYEADREARATAGFALDVIDEMTAKRHLN